jgi:Flp pilus assembly protein TadD
MIMSVATTNDTTSNAKLADLPVSTEVVQLLMEIGYVACGRGLQACAESIFNGIIAARPNSELPLIGLAISKISFGDFLGASRILVEQALKINPDSGLAKSFLAMAVKALGGKSEAEELAKEVAASETAEPEAKALAESFLSGKDIPADAAP